MYMHHIMCEKGTCTMEPFYSGHHWDQDFCPL